ncbi:MAG: YggT family protein, partial [Gammaproteobacteria bacterium]|nr:YggT family protein [Gammaproteobacteria bacterium]
MRQYGFNRLSERRGRGPLLRFLLQLVRADFYNPISQFLVTLTNPPLRPLRRLIPGLWGIDLASVLLL